MLHEPWFQDHAHQQKILFEAWGGQGYFLKTFSHLPYEVILYFLIKYYKEKKR